MTDRRRRADAQRNRTAIAEAARDLVMTVGPEVGMDEIAAEAGVAVGTLYRHFPSKAVLLEAIVDDLSASIDESLTAAADRVDDGASRAEDEITALLALEVRQERLLRFTVADTAAEALRRVQERGRNVVERLVAAAHRSGALYADVTVDDVILLLATAPGDAVPESEQLRWLDLARRALGPLPRDVSESVS
ncbi:TetR/AcrR family transcriptional regulator [Nocardia sp. alder85J]|uniref:TetR/AcrR family transcriptional regulator n=1 Tax=Nocardia sp. alder85J TaxID=2862949 RepID=UPI001CD70951|nr:TetR/AcrR family transcriptional regulator [Nocardia sp. alder85J]MCX4097975.1 helix-turn-helix domain containing protein [Nocardia sp. alder85J]